MASGMIVEGIPIIEKKLRAFALSMPTKAVAALYTAAITVLVPPMKMRIRANQNVFQGELFQRITAKATVFAGRFAVEVGAMGVPHGMAVEKGQDPGTEQDLQKLVRYARLKMGLSGKGAIRVAEAIKRTVEARGSKPYPFVEPVVVALKTKVMSDFSARLKRAMGT